MQSPATPSHDSPPRYLCWEDHDPLPEGIEGNEHLSCSCECGNGRHWQEMKMVGKGEGLRADSASALVIMWRISLGVGALLCCLAMQ